jgi:hypothetical protein
MGLVSISIGARCEAQPANPWDGEMPFNAVARLRPASSFEAVMLEEGLCGSATFRSLVATLETSDLIVYITSGACRLEASAVVCNLWRQARQGASCAS